MWPHRQCTHTSSGRSPRTFGGVHTRFALVGAYGIARTQNATRGEHRDTQAAPPPAEPGANWAMHALAVDTRPGEAAERAVHGVAAVQGCAGSVGQVCAPVRLVDADKPVCRPFKPKRNAPQTGPYATVGAKPQRPCAHAPLRRLQLQTGQLDKCLERVGPPR